MRRTILFSLVVLVPFWFGSTGMRPLCENDCIEPTPTPNPVTQEERILEGELPLDLIPTTRSALALEAAQEARAFFGDAPYDLNSSRNCASYSSQYARALGFPMAQIGPSEHPIGTGFPYGSGLLQLGWAQDHYSDLTWWVSAKSLRDPAAWGAIPSGSLIFFEAAISHRGYNTLQHVAVLLGRNSAGEPLFADYAAGMQSGPAVGRTLYQMLRLYPNQGGWEPYPVPGAPEELRVMVFDAIGASRQMWFEGGVVYPEWDLLVEKLAADVIVTVNVNDGTTMIFDTSRLGEWPVEEEQAYAVVGRFLKADPPLTMEFRETPFARKGFYDGENGLYWEDGLLRRSYTPYLIAQLSGFERAAGFGGLDGSTDIAILTAYVTYSGVAVLEKNYGDYSDYTIHSVPDVSEQDILLREPLLEEANRMGVPVPESDVHLSSGCVNYDHATWKRLKAYLQSSLDQGLRVVVVFSAPGVPQDRILERTDFGAGMDPFATINTVNWDYGEAFDRRGFFVPSP